MQPCKQRPGQVLPQSPCLPRTHRQYELGAVTPYPSLRQQCTLPLPWGRHRPDPALLAQLTDQGTQPFVQHSSPSLDGTKQPHTVGLIVLARLYPALPPASTHIRLFRHCTSTLVHQEGLTPSSHSAHHSQSQKVAFRGTSPPPATEEPVSWCKGTISAPRPPLPCGVTLEMQRASQPSVRCHPGSQLGMQHAHSTHRVVGG